MTFRKTVFLAVLFFFITCTAARGEKSSAEIKVLFSPEDNCGAEILNLINSAQRSIDAALYLLTSRQLAQGLAEARGRGVTVRAYFDEEASGDRYSKTGFLRKKGVAVRLAEDAGLMHNKFCIIDGQTVITGSYNWTVSADLKNDENVLIINSPEVAGKYQGKFNRLWEGKKTEAAVYRNREKLIKRPLR